VAESLDSVAASEWDALAGEDDPFIEHAFLHALESGFVRTGNKPRKLLDVCLRT
jgi:predicted N-acyltransferase